MTPSRVLRSSPSAAEESPLPVVSAAVWIAAGLLVAAGVVKLRRPADAHDALALADLPATDARVRVVGAVEVLVGLATLALGGTVTLALAVTYVAFTVLVARRRSRATTSTCGCFGAPDVPLTGVHVVVDGVLAAGAVAGAVLGAPSLVDVVVADGPLVLLVVVSGVAVVRLLLVDLPRLVDAMTTVEGVRS